MFRFERSNLMFCYDGSLEGFFSVVFQAYCMHSYPQEICVAANAQPALGQQVIDVQTDMAHAERIRVGIATHAGRSFYTKVKTAFLSDFYDKENQIFAYIVKGMDEGHRAVRDIADSRVAAVEKLVTSVMNEREKTLQFLRFEELESGVYFAQVNPKAMVIPIMMQYFVERYSVQPFVIYDEVHHMAGVYDLNDVALVRTDELTLPEKTEDELAYQALWKSFYDSVSNEQRYNPKLRTQHMPQRFWKNMVEFKAALK